MRSVLEKKKKREQAHLQISECFKLRIKNNQLEKC